MNVIAQQQPVELDEVVAFWADGFAGPYDLDHPPADLPGLAGRCQRIVEERQVQELYGRYSLRDWHLADPDLECLLTDTAIIRKVSALLGSDLLLWRSKIFYKPPGADAIGWHQEWGNFDGEEIGNSTPSLKPRHEDGVWDLTVWVALDDVTSANGPLQFARGTHRTRVPWRKVPMTQSAFYEEPFHGLTTAEIVSRTIRSELVLDIETAGWLDGFELGGASRDDVISHLKARFDEMQAKYTDFRPDPATVATMRMQRGQFVVFSERTMHGSPPNRSPYRRMAVNCRITRADTLVYPGRLGGNVIDGSNLDISRHESLLIAGQPLEPRNHWRRPAG